MREIRFRAWDKKEKVMEKPFDLYSIGCVNGENGYDAKYYILLQFTGLHDKNGKEIYEGDVYRTDGDEIGVVEFCDAHDHGAWTVTKQEGYGGIELGILYWDEGEVIGNIYENPELLK